MAQIMRHASMLPTIKCSSCNADIDIAMMGDHICSSSEPHPIPSRADPHDIDHGRTFITGGPLDLHTLDESPAEDEQEIEHLRASSDRYQRLRTSTPPSENHPSANHLEFSPEHTMRQTDNQTGSPASQNGHEAVAAAAPTRSATSPLPEPLTPPSPDMVMAQDSAFPLFPTKRSRAKSNAPRHLDIAKPGSGDHFYAPLSPMTLGGATVLRRMNSIAPGPFNTRSRKVMDPPPSPLPPGMVSDSRRPSIVELPSPPPIPAQPYAAETPGLETHLNDGALEMSAIANVGRSELPRGPPPPRPERPKMDHELLDTLNESGAEPLADPHAAINDVTDPSSEQIHAEQTSKEVLMDPSSRRSTDSSVYDDEGGGKNIDVAATSQFEQEFTNPTEAQPPPIPRVLTNLSIEKHKHHRTPTQSTSSSEAKSLFDDGAGSFRSSPQTSSTSSISRRKESLDDAMAAGAQELLSRSQAVDPKAVAIPTKPNFSRSRPPEPLGTSLSVGNEAISPPLESPMDPALLRPMLDRQPGPLRVSSSSQLQPRGSSLQRNAASGTPQGPFGSKSKGNCRGCNQAITGKSIKAADGRLTGRYHKECFVCKTCKQRFQTADFYVHNNNPYCAHHYHVLNHSLCYSCNTGIEGQYLEASSTQKYHIQCFSCNDCRRPLTSDYFEIMGQFYCEADAMRAHQKSRLLAPGRRFPERRTTKLMMM